MFTQKRGCCCCYRDYFDFFFFLFIYRSVIFKKQTAPRVMLRLSKLSSRRITRPATGQLLLPSLYARCEQLSFLITTYHFKNKVHVKENLMGPLDITQNTVVALFRTCHARSRGTRTIAKAYTKYEI